VLPSDIPRTRSFSFFAAVGRGNAYNELAYTACHLKDITTELPPHTVLSDLVDQLVADLNDLRKIQLAGQLDQFQRWVHQLCDYIAAGLTVVDNFSGEFAHTLFSCCEWIARQVFEPFADRLSYPTCAAVMRFSLEAMAWLRPSTPYSEAFITTPWETASYAMLNVARMITDVDNAGYQAVRSQHRLLLKDQRFMGLAALRMPNRATEQDYYYWRHSFRLHETDTMRLAVSAQNILKLLGDVVNLALYDDNLKSQVDLIWSRMRDATERFSVRHIISTHPDPGTVAFNADTFPFNEWRDRHVQMIGAYSAFINCNLDMIASSIDVFLAISALITKCMWEASILWKCFDPSEPRLSFVEFYEAMKRQCQPLT
jgi:hypothetical protein